MIISAPLRGGGSSSDAACSLKKTLEREVMVLTIVADIGAVEAVIVLSRCW